MLQKIVERTKSIVPAGTVRPTWFRNSSPLWGGGGMGQLRLNSRTFAQQFGSGPKLVKHHRYLGGTYPHHQPDQSVRWSGPAENGGGDPPLPSEGGGVRRTQFLPNPTTGELGRADHVGISGLGPYDDCPSLGPNRTIVQELLIFSRISVPATARGIWGDLEKFRVSGTRYRYRKSRPI